ncbi:uncharacterized protein LOC106461078 [Limulus polyphemus]|uniref:Uncharacterized protein LOC106461078 n=1 Tax=Limulus polyphemus TaxID=6850 RepID=A0ABM1B7E8_LIMPO|nr:uncharacterized protein LOC106461078 [Limulus polyphemus]
MEKKTFLTCLSVFLLCIPWGETAPHKCVCSIYASNKVELESTNFIRSKEHIVPDLVCDEGAGETCVRLCKFRFSLQTGGGDMHYIPSIVDISVGQIFCNWIEREVNNETVVLFSQICNEEPLNTGFKMNQNLCCVNGNFVNCT